MLELTVDDLIKDEAGEIDRVSYPETITVKGIELDLEYHFEPGAIDDGLHIILPVAYINQFEEQDFDWLVPGMLEDRIIALIRSLPKVLRRNFVPVPHHARQLTENMRVENGTFIEQLLHHLKQIGGIQLTANDFNFENLPENLKPLFYLTDMDKGLIIDTSRNLYQHFPDCGFERTVQSKSSIHEIDLYRGMKITDSSVAIQTFDNEQQAEFNSKESLKLLLIDKNINKIKEMKRHLPELAKAELSYSALNQSDSIFFQQHQAGLFVDLFLLISDIKISNDACRINSPELFEELNGNITQALLPEILEHINLLLEIFRQAETVRKNLSKLSSATMMKVATNLQNRMATLMYTGFLSETGWQLLHHYPRYLKSLVIRFERAELNPQAEHERSITWDKWWDKYTQVVNGRNIMDKGQTESLMEFRWLMEEFHVSLFAQQLGTKKSVSEKRLNIALDDILGV